MQSKSETSQSPHSRSNELVALLQMLGNLANSSDLDQSMLQNAIFEARQLDAKRRGWSQDRFCASCRYSDSKSIRDRRKRLRDQFDSLTQENEPLNWILSEMETFGFMDRIQNTFSNGEYVSDVKLIEGVFSNPRVPLALVASIIKEAITIGILRPSQRSNNYTVIHESSQKRMLRNNLPLTTGHKGSGVI